MEQSPVRRGSIRRRVTLTIFVAISVILVFGIVLAYYMGIDLLSNTSGIKYAEASAQNLASFITESIKTELESSDVYTKLPMWVDVIKEADLKYSNMDPSEIKSYLESTDKKWMLAKNDDPILWSYLNNRVSTSARDIIKARSGVTEEIILTDRYGGLVAASGKTDNFSQADKEWWRGAYNNGNGSIYLSDVEFDKSLADWVISIAVPVTDEHGIVGICKTSISIKKLLRNLENFKIGKTGYAFIVNEKGQVFFPRSLPYIDKQLFSTEEIEKLLSGKSRFAFMSKEPIISGKTLFVTFSAIDPPIARHAGLKWVVFIAQDASEMARPLSMFVTRICIVTGMLTLIMIPLGIFFGNKLTSPILQLHSAAECIMKGDLNCKALVKTNDEIEEFADTFNKMVEDLKNKQIELENLSRSLESKVAYRTKELTEAQERLEASNKELGQLDQLKSDFISTVSHELRTPLAIIKESVSLVVDNIPGEINEKQRKILEISKFNIDRLARIIDSLLDISKIEAGKVELRRNLINIADITRQVAASFETMAKEKGLELKLDVDKETGTVYADPDRITQVLVNLVNNSVKFTHSGHIEISCKDREGLIVCSVRDTGVGIAKTDLVKVFDKFQQFGRLAGAGEKGTGLGLSIAKGIIDMHNGSISAESEFGKGSCFTFKLRKYTEESLFGEFADVVVKHAVTSKSKASIIFISSKMKGGKESALSVKNLYAVTGDCARVIKNTLRVQGDEAISNNSDILVILTDCSKEHSMMVRKRFEQVLNKYLEEKKLADKMEMRYGCATFPGDGKTGMELINKARSFSLSGISGAL